MKLNTKLLVTHAIVGLLLLLVIGLSAAVILREQEFRSIHQSFIAQLYQVDFALTSFLVEVEYDVLDLVNHEVVRTRDDDDFTNFLEADETTFEYHYGETEQAIIDIFNTYRLSHPYANSVYMGRENGSFVRSHPRARPTQYDPRLRPWYQLGASQIDQVMRTAPYRSVTTPDVNIGTVKALVDEQGWLYGVVGIDITLRNLTDFISKVNVGEGSYIVLLDDSGIILTAPDEQVRFKHYEEAGLDFFQAAMENTQGYTPFEQDGQSYYLFYYTSPELGWKISAVVPVQGISQQVNSFVVQALLVLALSLLLLSALTVIGVRNLIVWPIKKLQHSAETIIQTGDLEHHIAVETQDEIGQLAVSFNEMIDSIRRTDQELRASEEQYRSLVENINVGVFRSTADGRLVHANSAALRILDYESLEELADVHLSELYEDPEERQEWIRRLQAGKTIKGLDLKMLKKDGTPIWVSLGATAQYDEAGGLLWLDGFLEDITARKEAEDALRRARDELEVRVAERTADLAARNAELDAFAHTVAHDLKRPAGIIVGYAEFLEETYDTHSVESQRKQLRVIARKARKMSTIVDELLLLASVREVEEIETRPLDMGRIVAEARRRLQDLSEELEGQMLLPEQWPAAIGYAPWVEEIWVNYLSNALKYGGRPPRVELGFDLLPSSPPGEETGTEPDDDPAPTYIRFWVRDNGPGLSLDEQASLFTPFERLHRIRVEGHGLGLSIVRRIVQRLGGEAGVESPLTGQGCTFYFTLPAAASEP